ncbi:MAG: hypothetical protein F4Z55_11225 [Boseongicola sp. SB0667_bin_21]|nr:hypothetical protein [Boseongicola sp. SB0667_bin_21]
MYRDLGRACHSLSSQDIDCLLDRDGNDDHTFGKLAILLSERELDLSDRAFDAFLGLLSSDAQDVASHSAWTILASNEPERLGRHLDRSGWSWSASKSHTENIMGSTAIAASAHGCDFMELVSRIAPAKVLAALRNGDRSTNEVVTAVHRLTAVLCDFRGQVPECGLEVIHDQEATETGSYECTFGNILDDHGNGNTVIARFQRASDPERHSRRRQEIIQSYVDGIREARESGAQLVHCHFDAEDFDVVLDRSPEALEAWLDGMDPLTDEFRRRARLAQGFYLALCEALFKRDLSRGIPLWRALRQCLYIQFINRSGIDRLKYAPSMARPCPEIHAVLEELYSLNEAQSDSDLLDFIVAARNFDNLKWLKEAVLRDEASACPAHRRRAAFLRPLLSQPEIAGDEEWPSGSQVVEYQWIRDQSRIVAQTQGFASYWLKKFAEADSPDSAHAYWKLFRACCDRDVQIWHLSGYSLYASEDTTLKVAKESFLQQQRRDLKRSNTEIASQLSQSFSYKRTTTALLPWRAR